MYISALLQNMLPYYLLQILRFYVTKFKRKFNVSSNITDFLVLFKKPSFICNIPHVYNTIKINTSE